MKNLFLISIVFFSSCTHKEIHAKLTEKYLDGADRPWAVYLYVDSTGESYSTTHRIRTDDDVNHYNSMIIDSIYTITY